VVPTRPFPFCVSLFVILPFFLFLQLTWRSFICSVVVVTALSFFIRFVPLLHNKWFLLVPFYSLFLCFLYPPVVSFFFFLISHVIQHTHKRSGRRARNIAGAEALAVARRPEVALRENNPAAAGIRWFFPLFLKLTWRSFICSVVVATPISFFIRFVTLLHDEELLHIPLYSVFLCFWSSIFFFLCYIVAANIALLYLLVNALSFSVRFVPLLHPVRRPPPTRRQVVLTCSLCLFSSFPVSFFKSLHGGPSFALSLFGLHTILTLPILHGVWHTQGGSGGGSYTAH